MGLLLRTKGRHCDVKRHDEVNLVHITGSMVASKCDSKVARDQSKLTLMD